MNYKACPHCSCYTSEKWDRCGNCGKDVPNTRSLLMFSGKVNSTDDVRSFFKALVEFGLSFHPDDPFCNYINLETKERVFTDAEALVLDAVMLTCFHVCEKAGVEIYEIGLEAVNECLRSDLERSTG